MSPQVRVLKPGDEAALETFLAANWAQTMILRSNLRAGGIADHGSVYQGTYAAAFEGARIVAAAAHYWNGNLVMQAPVHLGDVVKAAIGGRKRKVVELLGPWAQVLAARMILGFNNRPTATPVNPEVLYTLDLAHIRIPTPLAMGTLTARRAHEADGAVLTAWRVGFMCDAFGIGETAKLEDESAEEIARWTAEGRLWVLEDAGVPVSMTAFNAMLPDAVQVGSVYTPKDKRNKGYARAAVAASLLAVKHEGVHRAALFTEVINTPAQKSYESLGFVRAGDYGILLFVD